MVDYVCPGDRLGLATEFASGPGTYTRGAHVYASLLGQKQSKKNPAVEGGGKDQPSKVLLVKPVKEGVQEQVVEVGDIVMGRATRLSVRQVFVEILCLGETVLKEPHQGVVRREDIRVGEAAKLEMTECFRPGDIIRARVISLGDTRQYYLTTAHEELGVRWAKSAAGHIMVPVSWNEMQCPVTNVRYVLEDLRKAKKAFRRRQPSALPDQLSNSAYLPNQGEEGMRQACVKTEKRQMQDPSMPPCSH